MTETTAMTSRVIAKDLFRDPSELVLRYFEDEVSRNISNGTYSFTSHRHLPNDSKRVSTPLLVIAKDLPVTIHRRHVVICGIHSQSDDLSYIPQHSGDAAAVSPGVIQAEADAAHQQQTSPPAQQALTREAYDSTDASSRPSVDSWCGCGCGIVWECYLADIRTVLGSMAALAQPGPTTDPLPTPCSNSNPSSPPLLCIGSTDPPSGMAS